MLQNVGKHERQPARKSSFWGIRCESGKKYSQIVNQKYHISMAALDPTSVKHGKEVVSLVVERDGSEFLLCNLQKDSVLQVNLNLFFDKGEKVVFSLKGQGIVHLTGYLIKDENDQSDEYLRKLNDSIMLAKDKIKSSVDSSKHVHFNTNVSTLNDSWKVESKDKISISPLKNSASPKKSSPTSISSPTKSPQKQLFKATKEESEESSSDDDDDEESDDENVKQLQRFAEKRPCASLDDDDDDDEDDEDFEIDSSDESDEEEQPVKNKQQQQPQSNKKLKLQTSTPLTNKKSVSKKVLEVIEIGDDSKNKDMNSSIGRTPMPKKKQESKLQQKGILKESKQAKPSKDEESSDSDSDDEKETSTSKASLTDRNKSASQLNTSSEAVGSEKKKKKKKKKAKANDSTVANESTVSVNDSSFKTNIDLSKVEYSKKLPGGVEYDDLRVGNGPEAKKGRLVHVFYAGKFENNKLFDARQPGKDKPFVFKLGAGQVIKGWDLGIEGMKVGGKRRIRVPPNMGYKNQRTGPIPPNSTLYFLVQLKAVS